MFRKYVYIKEKPFDGILTCGLFLCWKVEVQFVDAPSVFLELLLQVVHTFFHLFELSDDAYARCS